MSAELEDIHEECGIFGVWGHSDAARLTYFGLHALQHRGQEGAGIVSNDNGHLIGHRGTGLLTQVFSDEREIERLKGDKAIGHVRYATAGSGGTDNIQPFIFRFHDGDMALCHNGNLTNCPSLRRKLEDEGAIFHSNSDTEVLMHLIRRSSKPTFMDKLKEALNTVHGGFAYLIMTEHAMIGALDPNGFRPLSLGRMTNGAYVLASETCALDTVGAELVRDIRPGEIVVVDDDGYRIDRYTDQTQLAICSMEFIYFARPDSNIYGVNVHSARKRMGARLAQESPVDADMVIAVPNSSLSAASGYSEEAGLPNEMGLIKNQYVARTFIQPTQELREQGVRMKLSAVRGVVKGKRVVVIDDSIVRGTTSKRIVQMLKEAGAAEVHMLPAAEVPVLLRHRHLHHQGAHRREEVRRRDPRLHRSRFTGVPVARRLGGIHRPWRGRTVWRPVRSLLQRRLSDRLGRLRSRLPEVAHSGGSCPSARIRPVQEQVRRQRIHHHFIPRRTLRPEKG